MVLCNFKDKTENTVTYMFGAVEKDITGIIVFNIEDGSFDVMKEPEKSTVYPRSLYRLCSKYIEDFRKGIFKEKIAFQSH